MKERMQDQPPSHPSAHLRSRFLASRIPGEWAEFWLYQRHPHISKMLGYEEQEGGFMWWREDLGTCSPARELRSFRKPEQIRHLAAAMVSLAHYLHDLALPIPLSPEHMVFHPQRGLLLIGQESWFPGCAERMGWDRRFSDSAGRADGDGCSRAAVFQAASLLHALILGAVPGGASAESQAPQWLSKGLLHWLRCGLLPKEERPDLQVWTELLLDELPGPGAHQLEDSMLAHRPPLNWFTQERSRNLTSTALSLRWMRARPGREKSPQFRPIVRQAAREGLLCLHIWHSTEPARPFALLNALASALLSERTSEPCPQLAAWEDPELLLQKMTCALNEYSAAGRGKSAILLIEDVEKADETDVAALTRLLTLLARIPCLVFLRCTHFHHPHVRRLNAACTDAAWSCEEANQAEEELAYWRVKGWPGSHDKPQEPGLYWQHFLAEEQRLLAAAAICGEGLREEEWQRFLRGEADQLASKRLENWGILRSDGSGIALSSPGLAGELRTALDERHLKDLGGQLLLLLGASAQPTCRARLALLAGDTCGFSSLQATIMQQALETWHFVELRRLTAWQLGREGQLACSCLALLDGKTPSEAADMPPWFQLWSEANGQALRGRHQAARQSFQRLASKDKIPNTLRLHFLVRAAQSAKATGDRLSIEQLARAISRKRTPLKEDVYFRLVWPLAGLLEEGPGQSGQAHQAAFQALAAYEAGDFEKAARHLTSFDQTALDGLPLPDQAHLLRILGNSHFRCDQANLAIASYQASRDRLRQMAPDHHGLADLEFNLASVENLAGRFPQARERFLLLLQKAEREKDLTTKTQILYNLSLIAMVQYDRSAFPGLLEEHLRLAHRLADPTEEIRGLVLHCLTLSWWPTQTAEAAVTRLNQLLHGAPPFGLLHDEARLALRWANFVLGKELPEAPRPTPWTEWRHRLIDRLTAPSSSETWDVLRDCGSALLRACNLFQLRCAIEGNWMAPESLGKRADVLRAHSREIGRPWLRFEERLPRDLGGAPRLRWEEFLLGIRWEERNPQWWKEHLQQWLKKELGPHESLWAVRRGEAWHVPTGEAIAHAHLLEDIKTREPALASGPLIFTRSHARESRSCLVLPYSGQKPSCLILLRPGSAEFPCLAALKGLERILDYIGKLEQGRPETYGLPRETKCQSQATGESDLGLVGGSRSMAAVRRWIQLHAAAELNLHIRGESGTGKELVARALHACSPRREKPFQALNCSQIPSGLIESTLFGHVRGAFTSATQDRAGLLEQLNGGTLFLDEIADLDARTQSLLLRVIQEGEFSRVGETRLRKVQVRILSATNRDLRENLARGSFRLDLLFRIAEDQIELPPLRRRLEDLPDLTRHFARLHGSTTTPPQFERSFFDRLRSHSWPGNVRELASYLRKLFVLQPTCRSFDGSQLPDFLLNETHQKETDTGSLAALEDEFRRATVLSRLESMGWNITRSATSLGLSRQRLSALIHQWGLCPPSSGSTRQPDRTFPAGA